jgi:flagellar biosynthesis regulator FlaF
MDNDRDREEILEDIEAVTVALDAYRELVNELDEFEDNELQEDLEAALADLELELLKFDKRHLN